MAIDEKLTAEVLSKNIREFEKEGVSLDEVRANFETQGGSPELWERAEELVAAEKMLEQSDQKLENKKFSRKWLIVVVLLVLAGTAGWWAWSGLRKTSFENLITRVQQLVSPEKTVAPVENSVAAPAEVGEVVSEPEPPVELEKPTPSARGVRRRPHISGS